MQLKKITAQFSLIEFVENRVAGVLNMVATTLVLLLMNIW